MAGEVRWKLSLRCIDCVWPFVEIQLALVESNRLGFGGCKLLASLFAAAP